MAKRRRRGIIRHMIGLTDNQLTAVMDAARTLPVEKRDVYLQRIAAMLTMRGSGHFTDNDVTEVARLALSGLGPSTGGLSSGKSDHPIGFRRRGSSRRKSCRLLP